MILLLKALWHHAGRNQPTVERVGPGVIGAHQSPDMTATGHQAGATMTADVVKRLNPGGARTCHDQGLAGNLKLHVVPDEGDLRLVTDYLPASRNHLIHIARENLRGVVEAGLQRKSGLAAADRGFQQAVVHARSSRAGAEGTYTLCPIHPIP